MKNTSISENIVKATKWSIITELAAKIVSPVTNMILARILAPEAFGIVATVSMIISFVDMFTDAGFQKYLVQHEFKDDNEKYQNTNVAFWVNLGLSFLLWGIIALYCEPIAKIVGNPGLGTVIAIACIQLPITSFSSIQLALYKRDFNFKTLFWVRMVSVFIPLIVTIPLALFGFNYWALIIGTICGSISNAVILTIKSKWKPKLFFSIKILKEMLSFSIWSLVEAISIWFSLWVDVLVIGSIFNEYFLGLYKTSTNMVNVLFALITASTISVLFPALSRMQRDNDQFNQTFLKVQRIASMLLFPMGVGVYIHSDLATTVLLGNQWGEASGVIGVWALTGAIKMIFCDYSSEVYRSKGRPKISFLAQVLHLIVLIPVCIIVSKYGFWTFVIFRSWIKMEFVFVHFILMKFIIGFPVMKMIRNILPISIATLMMGLIGYFLHRMNSGLAWSIFSIVICAVFYFGLLCLSPNLRRELVGIIGKFKFKKGKQEELLRQLL